MASPPLTKTSQVVSSRSTSTPNSARKPRVSMRTLSIQSFLTGHLSHHTAQAQDLKTTGFPMNSTTLRNGLKVPRLRFVFKIIHYISKRVNSHTVKIHIITIDTRTSQTVRFDRFDVLWYYGTRIIKLQPEVIDNMTADQTQEANQVSMTEFRRNASEIVSRVFWTGAPVVLTSKGKPMVRLESMREESDE